MTTIRIQKTEIDDKNIVILEVVSIDSDNFFHVHGFIAGERIDHRIYFNECSQPCRRAEYYFEHYITALFASLNS